MGNEFRGLRPHSAERFGESREHWWYDDYLAFRAREWGFDQVRDVLDVGSGVGHWGRRLAKLLPTSARVVGVDRESLWVKKAMERADQAGLGSRFSYTQGSAEQLPFEDDSFDLVTCQTVLMHLGDPLTGIREMVRVARPNGLVLVAEPTNVLGVLLLPSIALDEPAKLVGELLAFQFLCQKGKKALGEGDAMIGERLPWLFTEAGLERVEARTNDRAPTMLPPYASPLERAIIEESASDVERDRWMWDRIETRRYFEAGGGDPSELDALYDRAVDVRRRAVGAMRNGQYVSTGGNLFYLVWGWKRAPR